jgi:flagellar assembly factor FliW
MNTAELAETEKLEVKKENVINFPYGLLGFEHVKNYVLLSQPHEQPFMWLRMLDSASKAFLVVSPFQVVANYQPDIPAEDVECLGLDTPADALVVNIVTLRTGRGPTVNLKAPVIINRHTLLGKQVIPKNAADFEVCHPLPVA